MASVNLLHEVSRSVEGTSLHASALSASQRFLSFFVWIIYPPGKGPSANTRRSYIKRHDSRPGDSVDCTSNQCFMRTSSENNCVRCFAWIYYPASIRHLGRGPTSCDGIGAPPSLV